MMNNTKLFLRTQRALLFDWGDTLMRVFPHYPGPMSTWSQVEAMPYALKALTTLHPSFTLCLATNAADSVESDIRAALNRVGLNQYIDHVYCYQTIGHKKPFPEFFTYIIEDLALTSSQAVMIGDDYNADIIGALQSGLHAVWLNPHPTTHPPHPRLQLIPNLSHLPTALHIIFPC